jgi:hypothetical protein
MPMKAAIVSLLLTALAGPTLGGKSPSEEVGFLDLATAERSDEDLGVSISSLAGVTGLTPVPAFRLKLDPPRDGPARPGDAIELVVRLENIAGDALAIPWEANWKRVLGEVPGDAVKEFPEGYMYATLGGWVESAAEPEQQMRLPFYGQIYECLRRPGTVRFLEPGQSVRIRALDRLPEGVAEGLWALVAELTFQYGFPSARYERSVSSEPVSLEVLAPLE